MSISKKAYIPFPIDAIAPFRTDSNGIEFSTRDKGTAVLAFKVTKDKKPYNLSGTTASITIVTKDQSRFEAAASVADAAGGIVEYVIPEDTIKHYGLAHGQLILEKEGSRVAGMKFNFKIDQALADKSLGPVREFYVDSIEAIVADVREKAAAIEDLDAVKVENRLQEFNTQLASTSYEPVNTTFNADGTITEEFPLKDILKTTTFNADGSITEVYSGAINKTKTITFNPDGSISEVVI